MEFAAHISLRTANREPLAPILGNQRSILAVVGSLPPKNPHCDFEVHVDAIRRIVAGRACLVRSGAAASNQVSRLRAAPPSSCPGRTRIAAWSPATWSACAPGLNQGDPPLEPGRPSSPPRTLETNPPGASPVTRALTSSRTSGTLPAFSAALIVLEYAAQTSAPVIS